MSRLAEFSRNIDSFLVGNVRDDAVEVKASVSDRQEDLIIVNSLGCRRPIANQR